MKIIFDTNIYINWFREKNLGELLFAGGRMKYMAAPVIAELFAGIQDRKSLHLWKNVVLRPYAKTKRIVTPSEAAYAKAGLILAELRRNQGYDLNKSAGLMSDCLIALCARQIGAFLVTKNAKDFLAIQEYCDFKLVSV